MKTRQGILLLTLLIPGFLVLAISLYYFGTDYAALVKAESYATQLAEAENTNQRKLDHAYHQALAHRINVFADATWGLLGCLIASVGIHGLVTLKEKD
ncbi:hypothetical protein ACSQ6I_08830 [Anabaena sp. WFMT]|uniref:hypothetical protein n=1 Tax=Anabaena sp. WFMT TaxID=3449730 RepID=UPI003F263A6A